MRYTTRSGGIRKTKANPETATPRVVPKRAVANKESKELPKGKGKGKGKEKRRTTKIEIIKKAIPEKARAEEQQLDTVNEEESSPKTFRISPTYHTIADNSVQNQDLRRLDAEVVSILTDIREIKEVLSNVEEDITQSQEWQDKMQQDNVSLQTRLMLMSREIGKLVSDGREGEWGLEETRIWPNSAELVS